MEYPKQVVTIVVQTILLIVVALIVLHHVLLAARLVVTTIALQLVSHIAMALAMILVEAGVRLQVREPHALVVQGLAITVVIRLVLMRAVLIVNHLV